MAKTKSAKVQSDEKDSKRVVVTQRRYFLPNAGREVEAESLADISKALNKKVEDGDGNK